MATKTACTRAARGLVFTREANRGNNGASGRLAAGGTITDADAGGGWDRRAAQQGRQGRPGLTVQPNAERYLNDVSVGQTGRCWLAQESGKKLPDGAAHHFSSTRPGSSRSRPGKGRQDLNVAGRQKPVGGLERDVVTERLLFSRGASCSLSAQPPRPRLLV
ncbi:hypothetical protein BGZ60DRAFT_403445 [Tricladium varicosporioides]|nr:hypothetical protein BGZ60DRAFT_403445 [Hymenoscyphus varicosporioides]